MLIRLHNVAAVNPQHVAAMFILDNTVINLRMTNGRSFNVKCDHPNECPTKFGKLLKQFREYDDFYKVDETRAINVNHVIAIQLNGMGVVIDMVGDFNVYFPTKEKAETMAALIGGLEKYK